MARVHKLLLTLASSSALYSGLVPALGLGGITLHSALNQPLEADIQLLEVGDLSADEVHVRLASQADFLRSGVERIYFLNDLRFTPLFKGANSVIRVTSSKPIREPYLNFVVEVARPNGQLLREYTLLIDPPNSSAYRSVAEVPIAAPLAVAKTRAPQRVKPTPSAIQGNRYRVVAGDSLWLIAQRLHAGAGQTPQSLMAAIEALNPQAFVAGDVSRLKLGANLVLPDNVADARTGAPSAPLIAEPPLAAAPAPGSSNAEVSQLQQRLDTELAARAEENRQLQAAMLALQAQLGALQVQMQTKDQQLQALRTQPAETPASPAVLVPSAPQAVAPAPVVESTADTPKASAADSLLLWLVGGGSVLLGLLAGLLMRGRRAIAPTPRDTEQLSGSPQGNPQPAAPLPVVTSLLVAPVVPPAKVAVAAPVKLSASATVADALEGANIYIAYGRFSEALGVLRKAVQAEPERTDLRLRMLEVLGELGDSAGYSREESLLRQQGLSGAVLDKVWTRFAHVLVPEPEVNLDEAVLVLDETPLPAEAVSPAPTDDFQLNLEDLSLDADWDLLSPFAPTSSARSKVAVANDPAFRSDLQKMPEVSEVQLEADALSPFATWPVETVLSDEVIEAVEVDVFGAEPSKGLNKPAAVSLEHLATNRENLVKLNKALAYIAQGNLGSACSILNEVISDGDAQQQQEARALLAKIA